MSLEAVTAVSATRRVPFSPMENIEIYEGLLEVELTLLHSRGLDENDPGIEMRRHLSILAAAREKAIAPPPKPVVIKHAVPESELIAKGQLQVLDAIRVRIRELESVLGNGLTPEGLMTPAIRQASSYAHAVLKELVRDFLAGRISTDSTPQG